MKLVSLMTAAAVIATSASLTPAFADPGNGKGHGQNGRERPHHQQQSHRGDDRRDRHRVYRVADCPPGLAKKNPPCVPPGQARKHDEIIYGVRRGDILRITDYRRIDDLVRYGLEPRRDWSYYRDDDRIYRVDNGTRRILAVLNLIDAFTN